MKRNSAQKILLVLVGLWICVAAFQPPADASPAAIPTPQLTISKVVAIGVDTPSPTLAIEGANFGAAPSVYMGISGGTLAQLTVVSASNNFISAELTSATSAPGTYLLVVSRGPSTTDVFSLAITIGGGAVTGDQGPGGQAGTMGPMGPAGPAGPIGPAGPAGPAGDTGPAGAAGATGPAGPAGDPGPAGASGPAGPEGPAGAAGATGCAGPVGPTGPAGSEGPAGPMGPMGPMGLTGATGPAGTPGASATFLVTGVWGGSLPRWWTGTGTFFTTYASTSAGEEPARGAPMPLACTLNSISLYASTNKRGLSDTTDTITLSIYKNNVATGMTCSATSTTTVHQAVGNTCTSNPVSFNVGDTLGLEWTHTNPSGSLSTQYGAGLRCQ